MLVIFPRRCQYRRMSNEQAIDEKCYRFKGRYDLVNGIHLSYLSERDTLNQYVENIPCNDNERNLDASDSVYMRHT